MVACANTVVIGGQIRANGGTGVVVTNCSGQPNTPSWGGSGGAIRIIADSVSGNGTLRAVGSGSNGGGFGRIRIEANTMTMPDPGSPPASLSAPAEEALLWPGGTPPSVAITQIGSQPVPADPRASFNYPSQDVSVANPNPITVHILADYVPTSWTVQLRVVPFSGAALIVNATLVSGGFSSSVWQAQVTLPNGFSAMQVRAFQ